MSSKLANEKLRPFMVMEHGNTIRWVQEVILADGARETKPAANDLLYRDLEMRYGPGFAQWVIDGLSRKEVRS